MLRVTKAKQRLFEQSRHCDQLLRRLHLQTLYSKASLHCKEMEFQEGKETRPSDRGSSEFTSATINEGTTAAGSCPLIVKQIPVDGAAQQNGNVEALPALNMFFPSMNSKEKVIKKVKRTSLRSSSKVTKPAKSLAPK
ncbi:hypothetical protein MRX96_053779 [Rhipicephalus microplus]